MAFAISQDSSRVAEAPRLSLSVIRPPSTSPFPSPGSPFLPPPRLDAHEFALRASKIDPHAMRAINTIDKLKEEDRGALSPLSPDGMITPTVLSPGIPITTISSPVTPTPNGTFRISQQPQSQRPISTHSTHESHRSSISSSHRLSLTSSRPAPPSPAVSRRTSAALSRHSSMAKSRRASRATSLSQQLDHEKFASSSSANTVTPETAAAPPKRRSWFMKIRDFAYALSDDRHVGKGPDAPKANRIRQRMSTLSSTSSSSSAPDEADEDEDAQRHSSWGAFPMNTLSRQFPWGSNSFHGGEDSEGSGPSQTDFARNFAGSSPTEQTFSKPYLSDSDPEDEEDPNYYTPAEEGPLIPGLYRALYPFEPEGTAEMALEEEQVIKVIGRGGGVGWAIVERDDGSHALVPESYLDLIEPA